MTKFSQSPRIFVSYSHRGNGPKWKAALQRSLQVFEKQNLLDIWQDGKIRISSFFDDDIKQAMSNAQLAVVLLTREALESEYILNVELPFLRDRQQRDKLPVFPIVCEECNWKAHDWLQATQAPNKSNPIVQLSEASQDQVFRNLATEIAEELSRAALAELPKSDREISSNRIYVEKFPLTHGAGLREEKLIGREQELALLNLAFSQHHTAIVSLVAWGGVGKTMLVQCWLQRLQHESWFGMQRVYAWSFYSQGTKEDRQASEDSFLAHALEWFGVKCEPTLSPWDKGRLLADAVIRERTLLILDGIEPLQYPPGPMGGQLRAPGVQSLLKQLARKANTADHHGLCLVTTREPLTDLNDFQRREGSPWGSALRIDLGNLTEDAGAALLHHAGASKAGSASIKPEDKELLTASREVDGHALTLNLLGRFLARAHAGDIRRRDLVKFEEADRHEQGGTTFKMLAAFENWFSKSGEFGARQLAVLRILGLFDRPADADCIAALRKPPVIAGLTDPLYYTQGGFLGWRKQSQPLTEEDWNTAVSFLADFGLLMFGENSAKPKKALDCHPLVREYFAGQICSSNLKAWHSANRRLYEHLSTTTPDKAVPALEDLEPLYQAIGHGCRAGMIQQVHDEIHLQRIRRGRENYACAKLGAFDSELTALACFFERPWSEPSRKLCDADRAILLNNVSFRLRALGRLSEAIDPLRAALEIGVVHGNWKNAAIRASNLSELFLTLGSVSPAIRLAEDCVSFAEMSRDSTEQMLDLTTLADALHQTGRRDDALALFRKAEEMQAKSQPSYPLHYSLRGFQYCDLFLAVPERTAWQLFLLGTTVDNSCLLVESCRSVEKRAEQTLMWGNIGYKQSLLDIALDNLTLVRTILYAIILEGRATLPTQQLGSTSDDWANACRKLETTLKAFHRAVAQHHIPRGFLTRAWLHDLEGDSAGARSDLDEAWDIASRSLMGLHMADIHLYRARLFFREKHYPWKSPKDDLDAAEKLINECGYHRRDQELADAKRAILG